VIGHRGTPKPLRAVAALTLEFSLFFRKMRNRAIQKKLEQAELLVTLARHHVEWQRELIAELERKSVDTTDAVRLLAQFEHILDVHVANRDLLKRRFGPRIPLN